MKKILKFAGHGVLALVIIVAGAMATVDIAGNAKLRRKYAVSLQPLSVPAETGVR